MLFEWLGSLGLLHLPMTLYSQIPIDDPTLHNQTELLDASDEQVFHLFDPCRPSLPVRIYRFLCFVVFLAPVKFLFTALSLGIYFVVVTILGWILPFIPDKHKLAYRRLGASICWYPLRLTLLGLGIVWFRKSGKVDPDTRTFISNHLAFFDITMHILTVPIGVLGMSSLKSSIFVRHTAKMFDVCFVDRSKEGGGVTQQIIDWQRNKDRLPIVIFSEGKVTNGEGLLGFRTGGFLSDEKVQAMCVRYKMLFTPKGMATPAWLENDFRMYLYQLFSIPAMIVEVTVLPPLDLSGKDPHERAKMVQLQMANYFGCRAYATTNKVVFTGKKKEE